MFEYLKDLDRQIFIFLNGLHNEFFDQIMPWVTYKYTWFPLYAIIVGFLIYRYSWNGVYLVLLILATVGLADLITSGLMKPYFARLRPCYNPGLDGTVRFILGCGGKYGFASAHSATTFSLAMCLWLLFRKITPWVGLAFLWSSLVAYSRVYLGVHYPSDIAVGCLVGILEAWVMYQLYIILTKSITGRPAVPNLLEKEISG